MKDKINLINKVIITLYFLVVFLPYFGAHEIVNIQWFYVSILNSLSLGYIFFNREKFKLRFENKLTFSVFIGSIIFILLTLLSIYKSLLISESIVTLSFLVTTILFLFVFYVLISQNIKEYFNFFLYLILIIGFVEAYQVFNYFFENSSQKRSSEFLSALPHNYGNYNILAISIAMKFPLVIYFFITKKRFLKYFSALVLGIVFASLLFIGARTAVFSSGLLLILILIYILFSNKNFKENIITKILPLMLITFVAVLISLNTNRIHNNSFNSFNDLFFTKPKADLFKNNNNNKVDLINGSGRALYYSAAVNDIKHNPILGVGIGNWKLMPKKELIYNTGKENFFYPRRVHNDFLQVFAEIGVVGFLVYLSLFIIIAVTLLKLLLQKIRVSDTENGYIYAVLLASFLIYAFDSLFNFPHERTPIQVFAFFLIAIILSLLPKKADINYKKNYVFLLLGIVSIGFLTVSFKTYKASRIHKKLYNDFIGKEFFTQKYNISYNEMIEMLPDFPELDSYGRILEIPKAYYAYNSGNPLLALDHLNRAHKKTPYHVESHGLKAMLFFADKTIKNKDSAFFYAKKVFQVQPSNYQIYKILKKEYLLKKDTVSLINLLNIYTKIKSKKVDPWILKAKIFKSYYKSDKRYKEVLDSAKSINPNNNKLKKYIFNRKNKQLDEEKKDLLKKHYREGIKLFNQKKYNDAIVKLHEVLKLDKNNLAALVNLGVLERIVKNYPKSIEHLTKVINAQYMKNGLPEYNRGLSYYKLNKYNLALEDLQNSKFKGYKSADKLILKIKNK